MELIKKIKKIVINRKRFQQKSSMFRSSSSMGFTLIEALVAITVLTVSIAGPITIASKGLSSAMFARDQITAFYLAQEAVEFIRNKRDSNKIKGSNWLSGLGDCKNGSPCSIDVTDGTIKNCPSGCSRLKYNNKGFYNHSSGADSIFTRDIIMERIEDNEYSIKVTISWTAGINTKTFVVKEHIFNW